MKKAPTLFLCTRCEAQYPAWQGRCTECQAWGTIVQSQIADRAVRTKKPIAKPVSLAEVRGHDRPYRPTGVAEFDRVLSGGLVDGSLTLVGGNPGIGKSTLVLQVAAGVAKRGTVLYVSGEESKEQLKLRADRLKLTKSDIKILSETDVQVIRETILQMQPALSIIDSVQTVTVADQPGETGGPTQLKAATVQLLSVAKQSNVPIILVGHVTKEGVVAGPKMVEHLVDTVLYLEGDETQSLRLLRSVKHRFGVTDEVGVLSMTEEGLSEVTNPSSLFLLPERIPSSGTAITVVLEGTRPFLVEVQALVTSTHFGYSRRLASGIELARLELLLAVLIKRSGMKLGNQDVHVNLVGGLKVREPAIDLAVALAVASGFLDRALEPKTVLFGEVGLGGEIRPIPRAEQRLHEAVNQGFTKAFVANDVKKQKSIKVVRVHSVAQAIEEALIRTSSTKNR